MTLRSPARDVPRIDANTVDVEKLARFIFDCDDGRPERLLRCRACVANEVAVGVFVGFWIGVSATCLFFQAIR